jgi:hypothetical protein
MLRTRAKLLRREVVSNGSNFTATTGWSPGPGVTLAAVGGELELTIPALGSFVGASISLAGLAIGAVYQVAITCRRGTSTDSFGVNFATGFVNGPNAAINATQSNITQRYTLECNAATGSVLVFAAAASTAAGTLILNSLTIKRSQLTFR